MRTLWNSRILANGKWSDYISFGVQESINQLFYKTQIINIDRYGRNGVSKYLSLGNYHLGYWWHLSLPASYIYFAMGAVLPLASLFGWLSIHFIWLADPIINISNLFIVLSLALFSTTFFTNMFVTQNYNALGWIFFPLVLWALHNEFTFILSLILLIISFGSITVTVVGIMLISISAIYNQNPVIIFCFFPVALKILLHFYWSITNDSISNNSPGLKKSLIRTVKSIGISSVGAKYKRTKSSKSISKRFIFFMFLYSQFGLTLYYLNNSIEIIWFSGITIFIINSLLIRFSDTESIQMLMLSIASYFAIITASPLLLISYWLVITPPPYFLGDPVSKSPIDLFSIPLFPYNIKKITEKVDCFFKSIKKNDKVLFAFNDPKGIYENIFDGYRNLIELPLYVATKKNFLLFPSWWAVFENNFEGANEFWGRDINEVKKNVEKFHANYVITYNQTDAETQSFTLQGYKIVSQIDFADFSEDLLNTPVWRSDLSPPTWTLYKTPKKK